MRTHPLLDLQLLQGLLKLGHDILQQPVARAAVCSLSKVCPSVSWRKQQTDCKQAHPNVTLPGCASNIQHFSQSTTCVCHPETCSSSAAAGCPLNAAAMRLLLARTCASYIARFSAQTDSLRMIRLQGRARVARICKTLLVTTV